MLFIYWLIDFPFVKLLERIKYCNRTFIWMWLISSFIFNLTCTCTSTSMKGWRSKACIIVWADSSSVLQFQIHPRLFREYVCKLLSSYILLNCYTISLYIWHQGIYDEEGDVVDDSLVQLLRAFIICSPFLVTYAYWSWKYTVFGWKYGFSTNITLWRRIRRFICVC